MDVKIYGGWVGELKFLHNILFWSLLSGHTIHYYPQSKCRKSRMGGEIFCKITLAPKYNKLFLLRLFFQRSCFRTKLSLFIGIKGKGEGPGLLFNNICQIIHNLTHFVEKLIIYWTILLLLEVAPPLYL